VKSGNTLRAADLITSGAFQDTSGTLGYILPATDMYTCQHCLDVEHEALDDELDEISSEEQEINANPEASGSWCSLM